MKTDRQEKLLTLIERLRRNRFNVVLAKNAQDARGKILKAIPVHASVGVANSVTIRQIGILEALKDRGNMIIDPISMAYGLVEFDEAILKETMSKSVNADVFLSGTNAVTEDGKLVNIDGVGNRVVGIIWGSGQSIVVIGRNKIVKNIDAAMNRIKNMVTPTFAKRRQLALPCAQAGRCVDCRIPERACNITVILDRKPALKELTVVLVDEDLGLGWDTEWPNERIDDIRDKYERFDWPYSSDYRRYKEAQRGHSTAKS
jgi:hypothetical protein